MEPTYHDGWKIEYGGERPEFFSPPLYKQALDFANRKEAEGSKIEITYYVTTLGRIKPLYEKPITKELLSQMSGHWIEETRETVRKELKI